ncbi:MAG TPA: Hsp20/alpha crystallin family protein [Bryobacteraceae bacterium]|nr:Hsp20/alpha crystallin family protein [Bryobacteraceae bacterium]
MAEVSVTKQSKPERKEMTPRMAWDAPLFRGSLFNLNPFALMRQFTEDMDQMFGSNFGGAAMETWRPAVEIKQKDGKLMVTAELPGVKKEDIKVNVTDDVLTLEGERKQESEEKREGYYHSERSYGKFMRSVPLPEGAKIEQAAAQFNNGMLEITVPVQEKKPAAKEILIQDAPKAKAS